MRQQRGQDIGPDCRDYPEPERPGQWLWRVAGPPDQFLGVDQQALGAGRDFFPQGRQHHVAMAALKQRDAQPCLEFLDSSAQRRLGDGTTFRSTAEMALLGQSTQEAELLEAGAGGQCIAQSNPALLSVGRLANDDASSTQTKYERTDDLSMLGIYGSIACEHL